MLSHDCSLLTHKASKWTLQWRLTSAMVQWSAPKPLPLRTDVQWLERTRLSMRPSHTDRLPRSSHIVCTYSLMLLLLSIFLLHSLSEEIVVHVVCFVDPGVSCIRTWNCVPTTQPRTLNQFFFPMVKDQGQQTLGQFLLY